MLTFRHRPTGKVLGVNYKVLLTFATLHPDFEPVPFVWCDTLLWRDPLDRVVSLFFDKCRAAVDPQNVQNIQRELMAALGLGEVTDLRLVSLAEVAEVLPSIINRDRHVWPQFHTVNLDCVGSVVDIATGLPRLGRRLGVDFSRRENVTTHGPALEYYTPRSRSIIETIYAADYLHRHHRSLPFQARRLVGLIK